MKFVWLTWLFACYPLGSAELNIYYIGAPSYQKPCRFDLEQNDCDPRVLSKERIVRKRK